MATRFAGDGSILTEVAEKVNRWREQFDVFLNHQPPAVQLDLQPADGTYNCSVDPPTIQEILSVLRQLRNNKAPGEDGIPAEKGDRKVCSNYRGISLLDVAAKTFAVLLLKRFQTARDARTRPTQCGFRPGKGCVDQIFNLRHTTNGPVLHRLRSCVQFGRSRCTVETYAGGRHPCEIASPYPGVLSSHAGAGAGLR
ncbi:unnamed protein product [Acanthosepion pharaonis]|uniref:Reverse transcriptase domain-containing protein n=1 Tax=Acanthosepion pharaonis TaxID=158019 RepID=A0A812CBP7_ACAPH|nr:unnamed protein product [Sepia pharaonis]